MMEDHFGRFVSLSGWAMAFVVLWIHRSGGQRKFFAASLEEWRTHVEQTLFLHAVEEQLSIGLASQLGVAHRTLKHKIRQDVAEKEGKAAEFCLLPPSKLKSTLRKIDGRAKALNYGLLSRKPWHRRRIARD